MQRNRCLGVVVATSFIAQAAVAGDIDPNLQHVMDASRQGETISALVYLVDQVDLRGLNTMLSAQHATRHHRHETVVIALQDMAHATQGDLIAHIEELLVFGEVADYHAFWITNAVRVSGTPDAIRELSDRDDVEYIYLDYPIEGVQPVETFPDDGAIEQGGPEPGLLAINADDAWAAGYDGTGVLVSNIDTGVDGDHVALASRWAGLRPEYAGNPQWAWFDPWAGQNNFPYDCCGHGSHTMGTIVGGAPGDQIGVAPGAHWMAAGAIDRGGGIPGTVADAIESFEWSIDPDGNPFTVWDVPQVSSNSWGLGDFHGYPDCDELFWSYLDAMEVAGTVVVFAAGNEGTGGLRRPSDRATDELTTMAVAAVDGNTSGWPIAGFSSRGPTFCTPDGSSAIKPEVSAPGVDVRSASASGSYYFSSGTSMSCPHIAGVVALIRQACEDLSVAEVKQILLDATVDLGPSGNDNTYGYGMIDALAAVELAEDQCGPRPPEAFDANVDVPVDTTTPITLTADDDGEPMPPLMTFEITSLPSSGQLMDPSNGAIIGPGDLPYTLINGGVVVEYTPDGGYYGNDAFAFVADDGGSPPEGGDSLPATISLLVQFDAPSITSPAVLPDGNVGFAYGPVQLEVDEGQPEMAWQLVAGEYNEIDLNTNGFTESGVAQGWSGDDNTWTYELPFPFPFYGNLHTEVIVSSNGWLNFGAWIGSPSFNTFEGLIMNTRICALWDDLSSFGGGDIYIDESVAGEVTIRWDAVITDPILVDVNFACTLHENGDIEFHYGSGNTSLTPTIGISAGNSSDYVVSSYDGASDLENADSLEYAAPSQLPVGVALSPTGELSGTPTVLGTTYAVIRVTDALGRIDEKQFEITVTDGTPCTGDVNGNGIVDVADLISMLAEWGACGDCAGDLDGDGMVNTQDLLLLIANWGPCS